MATLSSRIYDRDTILEVAKLTVERLILDPAPPSPENREKEKTKEEKVMEKMHVETGPRLDEVSGKKRELKHITKKKDRGAGKTRQTLWIYIPT